MRIPVKIALPIFLIFSSAITAHAQIDHAKDKFWDRLIDGAITSSMKANKGKVDFSRHCQIEAKLCHSVINFKIKGDPASIVSSFNTDDELVLRRICTFNRFRDNRDCINIDTGVNTHEIQDDDGVWHDVDKISDHELKE